MRSKTARPSTASGRAGVSDLQNATTLVSRRPVLAQDSACAHAAAGGRARAALVAGRAHRARGRPDLLEQPVRRLHSRRPVDHRRQPADPRAVESGQSAGSRVRHGHRRPAAGQPLVRHQLRDWRSGGARLPHRQHRHSPHLRARWRSASSAGRSSWRAPAPRWTRRWAADLLDSAGIAFAVALLWVVHPLNTEVVDYLTERTESMMALFYLLTLYASLRARWRRPVRRAWMALPGGRRVRAGDGVQGVDGHRADHGRAVRPRLRVRLASSRRSGPGSVSTSASRRRGCVLAALTGRARARQSADFRPGLGRGPIC